MDNARDEEMEVLNSIYGDQIIIREELSTKVLTFEVAKACTLEIFIPLGYPTFPPITVLRSQDRRLVSDECAMDLNKSMNEIIEKGCGSEVLFQLIEYFREQIELRGSANEIEPVVDTKSIEDDSNVEKYSSTAEQIFEEQVMCNSPRITTVTVIHGELSMEKRSSFQSHFAIIRSLQDVRDFREEVLRDKRVLRATHNIFAFRFTCPSTGVIYHDNDDDGETAAGGRLAEMLRLMGVDGIAVIVSRWFGGILLGPDRFKFICNSARKLLEDHGHGVGVAGAKGRGSKKKSTTSQSFSTKR